MSAFLPSIQPAHVVSLEKVEDSKIVRKYRNDPYRACFAPLRPEPLPQPIQPRADDDMPAPTATGREHRLRTVLRHAAKPAVVEAAAAAPSAHPAVPPRSQHVVVKFKRSQVTFVNTNHLELANGTIVVVEGDRGEHMGTVARCNARRPRGNVSQVLRVATGIDMAHLERVRHDEQVALDTCRNHCSRLGLDDVMEIADVEFQMDYQKLTIFFRAKNPDQFVDFRQLQRVLFQHFRCRIWIVDC